MWEPPTRKEPDMGWEHYHLWSKVKKAALELNTYFKSTITVSGINATEIYSFGSVLGLTIEEEVVRSLNVMRSKWDDGSYSDCKFVRQAQTFPDVILTDGKKTLFGIELKSWYVLSKESEPSFRLKVNKNACTDKDLIMLVPWCLSNVLSGTPVTFRPIVDSVRYYCEYRNYWWKHVKDTTDTTDIEEPANVNPYPNARDNISDSPASDKGNNFGRIARMGILDDYKGQIAHESLLGVSVRDWRKFFKSAHSS